VRKLAVANQKGGSGKTTTTVNLAAALGERGKRVLVVDLDPQASATQWLGVADGGTALFDAWVNNGNLAAIVCNTPVSGVHLVPSSQWLIGTEKALLSEPGAEMILRRQIAALPPGVFDYVLLDCPPSLGLITVSALTAVESVIVPIEAHVMAVGGLAQLLQTVQLVADRLNPEISIAGIVACRVNRRTRHSWEILDTLRERFGALVFDTLIRENIRLAEAPSFAQPIMVYDPGSYGAADYRALATEFLERENGRRLPQRPEGPQ
jgi:chromosome partitioning protein